MCLVALALDPGHGFPLVVAANRDEFRDRPTQPLQWWTNGDARTILGGRDLRAGGTWLGVTRAGRLALLTNVRDPSQQNPSAPSRGEIVPAWLLGDESADAFAARLRDGTRHNGFNLIAADFARGECFWLSSREPSPRRLDVGVWGVSNASLDSPWPKVRALKRRLRDALQSARDAGSLADALLDALADRRIASDAELPSTGVPLEWERALSAAFIDLPQANYGTRCSTVLIAERRGDRLFTQVIERSHDDGQTRSVELPDWPPSFGQSDQSARTISTCGMPASSNSGPRVEKPARA